VAVSNSAGTVEVIDRRRVAIASPGTAGANQPYHFAENLRTSRGGEVSWELFCGFRTTCLGGCPGCGRGTARSPISCRRFCRPPGFRSPAAASEGKPIWRLPSAIVPSRMASRRCAPRRRNSSALSKILASHALIHTAEGEFFREAFSKACEGLDLSVTGFRERNLDECVQTTFGKAATRMWQVSQSQEAKQVRDDLYRAAGSRRSGSGQF
jgi:hypothetical protein